MALSARTKHAPWQVFLRKQKIPKAEWKHTDTRFAILNRNCEPSEPQKGTSLFFIIKSKSHEGIRKASILIEEFDHGSD